MDRNADDMFTAAGGAEPAPRVPTRSPDSESRLGVQASAPSGSGTAGIDASAGGLDYSETTASADHAPVEEQVRIGVHDKLDRVKDKARELRTKLADRRDVKADIERQVRDNPGRTLLIALAVGFVLGKAFRGNR